MTGMTGLISLAVALLAGLMMTRVMNVFRLPDVTAYLVAGVILGPCILGRLGVPGLGFATFGEVAMLQPISDVALGFIAFAIGSEFRLSHLRTTGGAAVTIGIIQAVVATALVDVALLCLHFALGDKLPIPAVITLGAIAAATAPAATLMVVRQYKAKGPLTDLLLPVVALDDAVGLMIFAISFGAAQAMASSHIDLLAVLAAPALEIILSLILGAVLGLCLSYIEKVFHSNRNRVALITSFIILGVAISMLKLQIGTLEVGFSSLLVLMMLGTVFCNVAQNSEDLMDRADKWSAPLLTLFFVLSGAALDLGVFSDLAIVGVGLLYILTRSLGKYMGAAFSAKLAHQNSDVQKYLGITLLPQAGVALGMSAQVGTSAAMGGAGTMVRNIVLFGVLIYELVGPSLTKWALTRAGDIKPKQ